MFVTKTAMCKDREISFIVPSIFDNLQNLHRLNNDEWKGTEKERNDVI